MTFGHGAAFGGSPSLSSYSGGVYSSPRMFAFANGGVFGEAGPEAIMPLKRSASGKLGVEGSGVVVQIIDQSSRGMRITTEESSGPNGKIIRATIRDMVSAEIASGSMDRALQSRGMPAYTGTRRS
jgi:phage-related minor tail protein